MSLFSHYKPAQRLLFFTQKRFNIRESIHRHTEPHKFKKHMLAACEPYIRKDYRQPEEKCKGTKTGAKELHPLEVILAQELLQDFETSEFILFLQYNYTPFISDRVYKNNITKSGGKFQSYNNNIYKEALAKFKCEERAINLFNYSRHALVTGMADKMPGCIKEIRKVPQYLLLGGYLDHQVYNVDELRIMCTTTDIDQCRVNLLSILDTPAIDLSSHLEQYSETIKSDE